MKKDDFKNKLQAQSGLSDVTVEIEHLEYPDYVQGFATAATWTDSTVALTDLELNTLNDDFNDVLYKYLEEAAQDQWCSQADAMCDAERDGD